MIHFILLSQTLVSHEIKSVDISRPGMSCQKAQLLQKTLKRSRNSKAVVL